MNSATRTIAGEELETIVAAFEAFELRSGPDGFGHVSIQDDLEIGVAFQRAIERYAADCLDADTFEPIETRTARALMRLAREVDTALGHDRSTK